MEIASSGPTTPARRARGDAGFTLIEIVLAVAIIAAVVLPVIGAVVASVRVSSSLRESAQLETVLQNAADRVNRAPKGCDYSVYVGAAAQSEGWSPNQATAQVYRYQPAASPAQSGTWVEGACESNQPSQLLVQKVVITVTSPSGHVVRSIQVVKSDV